MRDAPLTPHSSLRFWHHWLDRISSQLSGNHNPESLAQLADGRCKRSKEDIALSLEGTWEADHLFE